MISVTPHMKIFLRAEPVDFRKGIDGLASACKQILKIDPFSGCLFIFRNKRATAIKILFYDGQGFWLFQKRLSKGRFNWIGGDSNKTPQKPTESLSAHEFQQLLWNAVPTTPSPMWKKIKEGAFLTGHNENNML